MSLRTPSEAGLRAATALVLIAVASCGGGESPRAYTVGGTVTGLSGSGLSLQLNRSTTLAIAVDGTFTFSGSIDAGSSYSVEVQSQPSTPSQTCSVSNGSGTANSNVTDVSVSCVTNRFSIGGSVTGLLGLSGLTLRNNGADERLVTADGQFTFPAQVASGAGYSVSIQNQPTDPWQTCSISNAAGTVTSANVSSVSVECRTNAYFVGGALQGLVGSGLRLQINDAETIDIPGLSGSFSFPVPFASGARYQLAVLRQPSNPTQTCTIVSGSSGTIAGADIRTVAVSCRTNTYALSGTVSGLLGSGLVLRNLARDTVQILGNGPFTFSQPVESGSDYFVSAFSHPANPAQECAIVNGTGLVVSSPINNLQVLCNSVGRWLFVNNRAANRLYVAAIDQLTGALTPAPGSPHAVPGPGGASASPDGRFIYVDNSDNRTITGFSINRATGALAQVPNSPFPAGQPTDSPAIDPSGRFLYAADQSAGRLFGYRIDASTGTLSAVPGSPFPVANRTVAVQVHPNGRFAYALSLVTGATEQLLLHSYSIDDSTGALVELSGSPVSAGTGMAARGLLTLTPTGSSLHIVSPPSTQLRAYRLDSLTGLPAESTGSPQALEPGAARPLATARVPALYIGSNAGVFAFNIESQLSLLADSPRGANYTVPGNSSALAADPAARFLFARSSTAPPTITHFAIGIDGSLARRTSISTSFGIDSFVSDPSGRFLFGSDFDTGAITVFLVNSQTGSPTPQPASPFNAGTGAGQITITR